jgi:hypothetical protein
MPAMKLFQKLPDGRYIDADGRDITQLLKAYELHLKRSRAGKIGGSRTSIAKTKAVRKNGLLGDPRLKRKK